MRTDAPLHLCLLEGHYSSNQWSMRLYANELRRALSKFQGTLQLQSIEAPLRSTPRLLSRYALWNRLEKQWVRRIELPNRLKTIRAEVYHCLEPGDVISLTDLNPLRIVVTCHDLIPWRLESKAKKAWPFSWVSKRLYQQMKETLTRVARVITPSACTKRDVLEWTGLPSERVEVIPYWVNPVFSAPIVGPETQESHRLLRQRWGLSEEPFFLHVGSTIFYKNIENLLRALRLLRNNLGIETPRLVRVGSPLTPDQSALAKRLDVEKWIISLGERTPEELAKLNQMAVAVVFPSWYEGFGRPALEAMACGTPVIAGRGGALPEVVGEAGLLVDPGDPTAIATAMQRLVEEEPLRLALSEKGLVRTREFQQVDIGAALYTVYQDVRESLRGKET